MKVFWVLELGGYICSCDVLVRCAIDCLGHAVDAMGRVSRTLKSTNVIATLFRPGGPDFNLYETSENNVEPAHF
jgi:hypothetical protein